MPTRPGTAIHQGGLIAKLQNGSADREVRSPIAGRIRTLFAQTGQTRSSREPKSPPWIPAVDQVWEALRASLPRRPTRRPAAITPYERELPEIPDHIRQQALLTDKAIRDRVAATR